MSTFYGLVLLIAVFSLLLFLLLFGSLPQCRNTPIYTFRRYLLYLPGLIIHADQVYLYGPLKSSSTKLWTVFYPVLLWLIPVGYTAVVTFCVCVFYSSTYPRIVHNLSSISIYFLIPATIGLVYIATALAIFTDPGTITQDNVLNALQTFPYDDIIFVGDGRDYKKEAEKIVARMERRGLVPISVVECAKNLILPATNATFRGLNSETSRPNSETETRSRTNNIPHPSSSNMVESERLANTSDSLLSDDTSNGLRWPYPYIHLQSSSQACRTCQLPKPARSKHCSTCNRCVAQFDHHCVWINNCIGLRNYRWFLLFLLANAQLLSYGAMLCYSLLSKELARFERLTELSNIAKGMPSLVQDEKLQENVKLLARGVMNIVEAGTAAAKDGHIVQTRVAATLASVSTNAPEVIISAASLAADTVKNIPVDLTGLSFFGKWYRILVLEENKPTSCLFLLCGSIFFLVAAFLIEHIRYIYLGMTTNETMKWEEVEYSIKDGSLFYFAATRRSAATQSGNEQQVSSFENGENEMQILEESMGNEQQENHQYQRSLQTQSESSNDTSSPLSSQAAYKYTLDSIDPSIPKPTLILQKLPNGMFNRQLSSWQRFRVVEERMVLVPLQSSRPIVNIYDFGFKKNFERILFPDSI